VFVGVAVLVGVGVLVDVGVLVGVAVGGATQCAVLSETRPGGELSRVDSTTTTRKSVAPLPTIVISAVVVELVPVFTAMVFCEFLSVIQSLPLLNWPTSVMWRPSLTSCATIVT
jgi:hypothetical protein